MEQRILIYPLDVINEEIATLNKEGWSVKQMLHIQDLMSKQNYYISILIDRKKKKEKQNGKPD